MTLKGTKPAPESVEGLAVQAEALQHLAAVVMACAQHLKVAHPPPTHSLLRLAWHANPDPVPLA